MICVASISVIAVDVSQEPVGFTLKICQHFVSDIRVNM